MPEQKHIAQLMLEYAMSLGVTPAIIKKGIWTNKIDDHWTLKLNGQQEKISGVPGLSWFIEFNGWPAGIMSILGDGVLCAGAAGNEDNLRKAIEDKMLVTNGH